MTTTRRLPMLSFNTACEKLSRRDKVTIANNTTLRFIDAKTLAVRLHQTDIILIHENGTYTLNSGRWHTVTTKQRINALSPARLSQINREWFLSWNNWTEKTEFFDGIVVDCNGEPIIVADEVRQ